MLLRLLVLTGWVIALLAPNAVQAVNIKQCEMVANGSASIIDFRAQASDGRRVTLKGILFGRAGRQKSPALVMLPGSNGLIMPYCYGAIARQFAEWGIITLIVAPTTARDQSGGLYSNYSFADLARYAYGAADALAGLAQVDRKRIGLWGHSRGGLAAIAAVTTSATSGQLPFEAAVAIAAVCPAKAK
ncbi:MAG: alpha/beta hydrolase family protein, partial [Hyphomicrobiaceae bacterium]